MVVYVLGFVALSVISNGALMWLVRRAPVVEGRPRAHMMPKPPELPLVG